MVKDPDYGVDLFGPFPEEATVKYTARIKGLDGEDAATVDALKLTLYDKKSKIILNQRKAQVVLNDNGGEVSVTDSGTYFSMTFDPEDTMLMSKRSAYEDRVAKFTYTVNTNEIGKHMIVLRIRKLGDL